MTAPADDSKRHAYYGGRKGPTPGHHPTSQTDPPARPARPWRPNNPQPEGFPGPNRPQASEAVSQNNRTRTQPGGAVHDAQQHINDLTRRQKIVIEFLPGHTYTATAPSLLAQLRAAAGSSNGGRGGRTVPGSRLPVNTDALDLWTHVLYDTHTWAHHLGINRRPYVEPPLAGEGLGEMTLPPTGRLLRAVFAQAIAAGRHELAEQVGHRAGRWTVRIEAMFAGTMHVLPLRNYPCGECGATAVVDDRDGERYRIPAVQAQLLALEGAEHLWPYLTCLACGANGWLPYRANSYAADVARTLAPTERIAA